MKFIYLIIRKFLSSSKDQKYIGKLSFFSYILVGLGVAVPILVLSVTNGFQEIVESRIINYDYHLQAFFPELTENLSVKPIAGVKITPFYEDKCLLKSRNSTKVTQIRAYALSDFIDSRWNSSAKVLAGNSIPSEGGIILAESLAANLRVGIADDITLIVIDNSMGQNQFSQKNFRIDGIISLGYAPFDVMVSFITKNDANSLFLISDNTINKLGFEFQKYFSDRELSLIEKKIIADYPSSILSKTLSNKVFKDFKEEKKSLTVAMFIIMLIAFIAILITINVVLADKFKDIGLLKVLGIQQAQIINIFLGQGIWIAFVGVMIGFFFGTTVVANLDDIIRFIEMMGNNTLYLLDLTGIVAVPPFYKFQIMPEDVFYLSSLPYKILWEDFVIQGIGAFIFSIAASYSPARKALNAHPSEILRNE